MKVRRLLPVVLVLAAMLAATSQPLTTRAAYVAPAFTFPAPTPTSPSVFRWQGQVLQSPDTSSGISGADPTVACSPDTVGDCEDTKLTVPANVTPSSLYIKVSWVHPNWKVHMYVISPDGKVIGAPLGCDTGLYEKGCGNESTLTFDEVTVRSPKAGVWTVRVAAVNIHDEAYSGIAAFTNTDPVQYARRTIASLQNVLTRRQQVNLVFAGWKPTPAELKEIQDGLPDDMRPSVAGKQSCDGDDPRDNTGSGLVQHLTSHCTATDPTNPGVASPSNPNSPSNTGGTPAVPYFEPLDFKPHYNFYAADDVYTKDLFAAIKAATKQDVSFGNTRIPATGVTTPASAKAAYLSKYDQSFGNLRGTGHKVADATVVDEVDGLAVEDWVQKTRLDAKYCNSFTDLASSQKTGGQFINPDPNATRDPFWGAGADGTGPLQIDRNPQGVNRGITFFLLDTFYPTYADSYFRPDHYHTWGTVDRIKDPDTGGVDGFDNGRGWGGRYRFSILDLGAAPSNYERSNWLTSSADPNDGSAGFDPPIWQYRNDPHWQNSAPPDPLQAGGNTIGQVLGWEINQGLAFKYIGSYLYRPIPADFYRLATQQWVDHYSTPGEGDFYSVDLNKVYKPALGMQALRSAIPYATFEGGNVKSEVLGCARQRAQFHFSGAAFKSMPVKDAMVPDPRCSEATYDPRQEALELAKSHGTGIVAGVAGTPEYDLTVNQDDIRNFIDHNRQKYAPALNGAFTVPVVNVMFEKVYTVALPLIVGGIAESVNGGDGWGQIDNVNDQYVLKSAIDCANSLPAAPGCNGVPDTFRHDVGFTYTVQHEAAHVLGLPHPHDGSTQVEKGSDTADPKYHYYYSMLKWLYDVSASPTTYGAAYGTYEVVDQERLIYGHTAEYLKRSQDWIADSYFMDGVSGASAPSAATQAREALMEQDRQQAGDLFKAGDYLHAQYAMKNAALHAKGVTQAPVAPHQLTAAEAAADQNAIFAINPQTFYVPDGCGVKAVGVSAPVAVSPPVAAPVTPALPDTSTPVPGTALPTGMLLLSFLLPALLVLLGRRRENLRGGL
jgi:hypothetical protein